MSVKGQLLAPPYKAEGARLRAAREAVGLRQADLAAKVGLTQKQISTLEGGHSLPMAAKLPVIAKCVGATVDWLLTGEGKAPRGVAKIERERLTDPDEGNQDRQRKRG